MIFYDITEEDKELIEIALSKIDRLPPLVVVIP